MVRILERKALWCDRDRAIRSTERGIDSIVVFVYVQRPEALEGNRGDFPIRRLAADTPEALFIDGYPSINNATYRSMPNVVPTNAFRFTALPSLRRHYGQKFAWRAHSEPLPAKEQPTVTNEDGTKTLRVRTNVSGKESALPLPPLMDPIAMAAKQKYRPSKPYRPRPNPEKMTKFQQELAVNPYGKRAKTSLQWYKYLTPYNSSGSSYTRPQMHFYPSTPTLALPPTTDRPLSCQGWPSERIHWLRPATVRRHTRRRSKGIQRRHRKIQRLRP